MWHSLMQVFLLLTFATLSVSVEWRRTGLILSGFALLYLGMNEFGVHWLLEGFSPPYYAVLYAGLDLLAVRLLFAYGSKGARVQALILCAFVSTHLLQYLYTIDLPTLLDPHQYIVVTFTLAILQMIVALPGVKDGVYDLLDMVQKVLEDFNPVPAFDCVYPDWENGRSVSHYAGNRRVSGASGRSDFQTILHGRRLDSQTSQGQQQSRPVAG